MVKYANVAKAAELLNVSPDTIRRWEKKGLIKASRDGKNYRVFDLEEIKRLNSKLNNVSQENNYKILRTDKKNGYTSIDLFAGAGGTALGLENSGFEHLMLNEIDKNATETLKINRPNWNVLHKDVANIDFTPYEGKVDLIEGGFPCQAFSYAGKSQGFADVRGTLFFEFARAVKEAKPKIAMGENVKGLLRHDGGKTLHTMINILEELGYRVAYKVLRSQYLDVPQKRERLIILAIRNDLDMPFVFPKEKNYTVSLKEAIGNVTDTAGQIYNEKKKQIMKLVPEGGYWRDLPEDIKKAYMGKSFYLGGGKTGMARRLSWNEPSLTLTCNPAQKQTERCHPSETRPLNVREYARIQTFPDTWKFVGSVSSQYKQIGNAVPVNLGYHMGTCIAAMLDKEYDPDTMAIEEKTDLQPLQISIFPQLAA
jgi:DNA (cytosine-5)-methyltransferase 1